MKGTQSHWIAKCQGSKDYHARGLGDIRDSLKNLDVNMTAKVKEKEVHSHRPNAQVALITLSPKQRIYNVFIHSSNQTSQPASLLTQTKLQSKLVWPWRTSHSLGKTNIKKEIIHFLAYTDQTEPKSRMNPIVSELMNKLVGFGLPTMAHVSVLTKNWTSLFATICI